MRNSMENSIDYDAVVFDMDGVIFDSERAVMQCWKELAEKYQIPDIEQAVLSCTGTTMKRTREIMLETYGADFPYDTYAKESSAIYHSRYDGGRLPMKPGVVELLTFLKDEGKKIALASSTRRQTVTNQLRDAGILDFFDKVICGDRACVCHRGLLQWNPRGSCGKTAPDHGAGSAAGNGGDAGKSGSGVTQSFRSDFIFKS